MFCDIAMCTENPGGEHCRDGYCSQRKVWERLKMYEDLEASGRLLVLPPGDVRPIDANSLLHNAGIYNYSVQGRSSGKSMMDFAKKYLYAVTMSEPTLGEERMKDNA
jgi:hypothetical protein